MVSYWGGEGRGGGWILNRFHAAATLALGSVVKLSLPGVLFV